MSGADRLKRDKRALRARIRALRDALPPPDRDRYSATIARGLFELPEMVTATTVMVFSSFGSEVDTAPILERLVAEGRHAALPRVANGEVEPVAYRPGGSMRVASFGAMEPIDGEPIPPEDIDVVVTPGVAFDRRGHRVGYGGGFYDRFFRRTRPDVVRVGIGFGLQVVDAVPHGGADVPVDLIVTDEGVVRCG
ncbi:MAG TPA: 5-formyltetrahydrofolate cyclo-ligase [Actinomycetota bacterium]